MGSCLRRNDGWKGVGGKVRGWSRYGRVRFLAGHRNGKGGGDGFPIGVGNDGYFKRRVFVIG